ncbi:MAG: M24 family metallopeptidase [Candidatus Solibacter usitatus]|nr:M24 family metallopeptidase [Candidatus Solibacter usitatus]
MFAVTEIQTALREASLDGWLFYDHHVRDPLAYRVLRFAAPRIPTRRWYYFIPANGEPCALVHRIEPGMLDALPGVKNLYSSWETMRAGLAKLLGDAKRIAMQHSANCEIPYVALVDAGTIDLVRGMGVDVQSSADLVQVFESRWSAEQLESHLEAGRRVDAIRRAAFEKVSDALRAGRAISEHDVAGFIRDSFSANGLFTDHGPIVAVNANASNPHYEPTAEAHSPIHRGDLVLIDMWAKLTQPGAVYYDITWTGFCGAQAPDDILRVFEVVKGGRNAAVNFVKGRVAAGQTPCGFEVDDAARNHIRGAGFADYFVHRTGHSIGEEVHGTGANMDNLESHDTRRTIARTCFSVEPGVYLERFGIRSEVNVYVSETAARVTGEEQEALLLLCES